MNPSDNWLAREAADARSERETLADALAEAREQDAELRCELGQLAAMLLERRGEMPDDLFDEVYHALDGYAKEKT